MGHRLMDGQGNRSPMRKHIVGNIRCRLAEEKERDTQAMLDTQQRCMNIRKNLSSMLNSRREFSAVKQRAQVLIEGELPAVSEFAGLVGSSKSNAVKDAEGNKSPKSEKDLRQS